MTYRTTVTTLRHLVAELNRAAGHSIEPYYRDDNGNLHAVLGCYVLDCAYGDYRLAQMVGDGGGERNITKRYNADITADLIRAYMDGLHEGERTKTALITAAPELYEALKDALSALRYIREHYHDEQTATGDLYGVGFQRVESSAQAALAKAQTAGEDQFFSEKRNK